MVNTANVVEVHIDVDTVGVDDTVDTFDAVDAFDAIGAVCVGDVVDSFRFVDTRVEELARLDGFVFSVSNCRS